MRYDPRVMTTPAQAMSAFIASDQRSQRDYLSGLSGPDMIGFDEGLAAVASVVAVKGTGPEAENAKAAIDAARRSVADAWSAKINSATPAEAEAARKAIEGRKSRGNPLAAEFLSRVGASSSRPVPPAYSGIRWASGVDLAIARTGGTDAAGPSLAGYGAFRPRFVARYSGGMAGLGFTSRRSPYEASNLAGLGSWFSEIINKGKEIVKDVAPVVANVAKVAGPIIGIASGNPGAIAAAAGNIMNSQLPTTVASVASNAVVAPPNPIAATTAISPSSSTLDTILGVLQVLWGGNQPQPQPQYTLPPTYTPPAPAAASASIDPKLLIAFGGLALLILLKKK